MDLLARLAGIGRSSVPAAVAAGPVEAPAAPAAAPAAQVVDLAAARPAAPDPAPQIAQLCSLAGVPDMASAYQRAGLSVDQVRHLLLDARAQASDQAAINGLHGAGTVRVQAGAEPSFDDPSFRCQAKAEALAARLDRTAPTERARPFVGMTASDIFGVRAGRSNLRFDGGPGIGMISSGHGHYVGLPDPDRCIRVNAGKKSLRSCPVGANAGGHQHPAAGL